MIDEDNYCNETSENHRRDLGQFFTPPLIASFMIDWILESGELKIFDPAFGLGAFYSPVENNPKIEFSASEIDPNIIRFFIKNKKKRYDFIVNEDYLTSWGRKYTNIVCNPPYARFQKFVNRDKVSFLFQNELGIKISGYTNTASAFLLKSISEMDGTGRLAYIMPLEFLNAGYGKIVKEKLIASKHLFAIMSFNCEKEIFPSATTSVGIIFYDSKNEYQDVRFYTIESIDELQEFNLLKPTIIISYDKLDPLKKWLPYFHKNQYIFDSSNLIQLNNYGHFLRGIATGANEFFVLRPSDILYKGIQKNEYIPCITKSSQIRNPIFLDEDLCKLESLDSPVCLVNFKENHSKEAENYIKKGEELLFQTRFLTRNRTPWYKIEDRIPYPILLGVFSRGGYKVVLNRSRALTLTCFHGFDPNFLGLPIMDMLFLFMASKTGRKIISLSRRKYGDNLDKFEPNDLNFALVPNINILSSLEKTVVEKAISHIRETGIVPNFVEEYFENALQIMEISND